MTEKFKKREAPKPDASHDTVNYFSELLKAVFSREVYSALVIDFYDLYLDYIVDVYNVRNLCNTLVIELRNMDKSLLAGGVLDECAEVHYSRYSSLEHRSYLGIVADSVNYGERLGASVLINCGNEYASSAR